MGPEPATSICDTVINAEIDSWVSKKHFEEWKNAQDSKIEGWAEQILAMSSRNAKAVVGIITNYGTLRKHRYTMRLEKDPVVDSVEKRMKRHCMSFSNALY